MEKKPIREVTRLKRVNKERHQCIWIKEKQQSHPTLISYICKYKKCGRGLMLTKEDNIDNYKNK